MRAATIGHQICADHATVNSTKRRKKEEHDRFTHLLDSNCAVVDAKRVSTAPSRAASWWEQAATKHPTQSAMDENTHRYRKFFLSLRGSSRQCLSSFFALVRVGTFDIDVRVIFIFTFRFLHVPCAEEPRYEQSKRYTEVRTLTNGGECHTSTKDIPRHAEIGDVAATRNGRM